MESIKVSIIIPVFNCEKYIGYAIQSALNQTYKNIEVIVVDDGSFDDTFDIAKLFNGITVLMKTNGGTASALNTGIRNSTGEYIKWLSADDVLYYDAIENMMKYADSNDTVYYTNYDYIDSDGNITGEFIEPERDSESSFKELMLHFFGNGSSSLIHRDVFEKIGLFDDSLPHSEDYEFWLRAASKGIKIKGIPIKTLKYRLHPEQLTNTVGGSLDEEIKAKYLTKKELGDTE